MRDVPPLFAVGNIRSGTTILHRTLLAAWPHAVDLDDLDDFESRVFWQQFGCQMGSPSSGTRCVYAGSELASAEVCRAVRRRCEQRTSGMQHIVNKNPHLSNKILFVHAVLPEAKFIHIIRDVNATVASMKIGMEGTSLCRNSLDLPFVHYWPETNYPCWYAIPASSARTPEKLRRWWERVLWFSSPGGGGLRRYLRMLFRPPRPLPGAFPHEDPDEFRSVFPDETRYYPGKGFARIPESWVTINANIVRQFRQIPESQWTTVNYDEFCSDTRNVVTRLSEFIGAPSYAPECVPEHLDIKRRNKWKKNLTADDQKTIRRVLAEQVDHTALLKDYASDIMVNVVP